MRISRREFIEAGAVGGVALLLGLILERGVHRVTAFTPNPLIRIDADGTITVVAYRTEMGQGVRTALPMIVADELGANWAQIRVAQGIPGAIWNDMRTGGSSSVIETWEPMRRIAAAARVMLIGAAARELGVDVATCHTEQSAVVHEGTGRRRTFGSLVAAARSQPVPADPPLRDPATYDLIGSRVRRVDGPAIVRGGGVYALDIRVPNMRVATIARCPIHGGRVGHWNGARARRVNGVRTIVPVSSGVAVVADHTWAAIQGRAALDVEWDAQGNDARSPDSYHDALEAALLSAKSSRHIGDVAAALRASHRTMDATYRWPFQAHAAIEPLNCIADVRRDTCDIWVGTQAPNEVQTDTAKLLGIPPERVTVHLALIGGGFGRRLATDYALEAVEISRAIGGPVQLVWTREDDIQHDMYNPGQVNRIMAGLDANGEIRAWRHEYGDYFLSPMYGTLKPTYDPVDAGEPWGGFDSPYTFANADERVAMLQPTVPCGAWRSVKYPGVVLARECMLDEIAHAVGRDPIALRLALLESPAQDRLRAVIALVAERGGWHAPWVVHREGRRWGRGFACNPYRRTKVAQIAEVSVGPANDIRVHRVICAFDCGRMINPLALEAQIEGGINWGLSAALKTEITFAHGRTRQTNFDTFPPLRMAEAPAIEIHCVANQETPSGAGEPPVPPVAPAVLNAIFAATGRRVRHVPVRPADLI
jgi:isoquinoline 1-oxidoreductase subunit beta